MKKQIEEIYFNCLDEVKCLKIRYEEAQKELKNRYTNLLCEKILGKYLVVDDKDGFKILHATDIDLTITSNTQYLTHLNICEYLDNGIWNLATLDHIEEIFDTEEEAKLFLAATN